VVTFWFSAQDFTFPTAPPGAISWAGNLEITSNDATLPVSKGTVALENCVDTNNGNTPGGVAPGFCSKATDPILNNTPQSWTGTSTPPPDTDFSTILALGPDYALQEKVTLTFNNAGSVNFITSQVLTPVPEPGSVLLLGGVLLGISGLIRKKIAKRS
jgi:hypothetical protein